MRSDLNFSRDSLFCLRELTTLIADVGGKRAREHVAATFLRNGNSLTLLSLGVTSVIIEYYVTASEFIASKTLPAEETLSPRNLSSGREALNRDRGPIPASFRARSRREEAAQSLKDASPAGESGGMVYGVAVSTGR